MIFPLLLFHQHIISWLVSGIPWLYEAMPPIMHVSSTCLWQDPRWRELKPFGNGIQHDYNPRYTVFRRAGIFYILMFSGFISTFSPQKGESDKIGYSATAKHVFYNLRESSQLLFLMHVLKLSSYTCWSCLSKIVFQACQRFTPATVSNVSSFFVLPVRGVLPELPESCVHHGK